MHLPFTYVFFLGFCIYLLLFAGIVLGCNYAFRRLADARKAILIPIALDVLFILYYAMCRDYSTEVNALAYLFAGHYPFVAVSFCRKILKFHETGSRIGKCVLVGSILLYVFAIGDIVFALTT